MLASCADIKKHKARIARWQGMLTDEGYIPEKQMMQMLRSAIRKVWMHSPVKLLKLAMVTFPDPLPDTRTKWRVPCERCHGTFKKADVEVDHVIGGHSLKTLEDLENFYEKVLHVRAQDLQVLCKECHGLKTFMERHPDMSEAEAVREKKVLAWLKLYPQVARQKNVLLAAGFTFAQLCNAEKRRTAVRIFIEDAAHEKA